MSYMWAFQASSLYSPHSLLKIASVQSSGVPRIVRWYFITVISTMYTRMNIGGVDLVSPLHGVTQGLEKKFTISSREGLPCSVNEVPTFRVSCRSSPFLTAYCS